MKEFFKKIQNDRILFFGFLISFILIVLTFLFIILNFKNLPPFIPIFNQMPWGNERLGNKEQIFIPFFIALLLFVSNNIFSLKFYNSVPLISRIFCVTGVLISFLTLLLIIRTVLLVV
ncbi:MAG: hypothetical protein Q7R53_00635 [bacterium]|nr:hypothetical protein [bacterium]